MSQPSPRDVLNHLIESCRDGEHGFRHAASLVTDQTLQSLFNEMADQRQRFAAELLPHAQRFGDPAAAEGTKRLAAGAFATVADLVLVDGRLEPSEQVFLEGVSADLGLERNRADVIIALMRLKNAA